MRTGLTVARVRRLLPAWNGALHAQIQRMRSIEACAVMLSALGVWLNVRRNRLCWRVRLYSGMVLQCAYIALETDGWRRSSIQHASHRDVSRRMHVMPIPRRM